MAPRKDGSEGFSLRGMVDRPLGKATASAAAILAMSGVLAGCEDGNATPSPTTTIEQTATPSPEQSVTPSPEAKAYDLVIEQLDSADFAVKADPANLDPQAIAQALLNREEKIVNLFANPESIELAHEWYKDKFDEDMNADMGTFRREQCQKVVDKLSPTYYATTVDAAADTRSLDEIGESCYNYYSLETAAIADGIEFSKSVTLEDGATLTALEDGSYISESTAYTKTNADELEPGVGSEKTERRSVHFVIENGEIRVISASLESI